MAQTKPKIGWIGMGRMGYPMAERLIKAGYDVAIWNRTRSKAEPLAKIGAEVVDKLFDLKEVDILFSIVSTGKDLEEVVDHLAADLGERLGLGAGAVPDGDVIASLEQALGHGKAHAAHADPSDLRFGLCHCNSP